MRRLVALLVAAGLGAAIFVAGALLPTRASQGRHLARRLPSSLPSRDLGSGAVQRTIASLQARLEGNHRDVEALASLGLAYLREARLTGDPSFFTKADEVLTKSVAVDSKGNFQGLLGMGLLASARHRFDEALRWGKRAKAIDPYSADVRGLETDALVELGRYDAARRQLQKMVDLRPGLSSLSRISYYRELHGDLRGALEAMHQAFQAAVGSGQDAAWASYELGDLQLLAGHVQRAAFLYRRGIYLDPTYYLPKVGMAKVAAARGELKRAARILKSVVNRYPAPVYVMLLGDIYRAQGRQSQAKRQYDLVQAERRLLSANGVVQDTEMMIFAADHHQRLHSTLRDARAEFSKRPSVRVADALSWVLYANGRYMEAWRYTRAALRLRTLDPTYYFHAGMIAKALGKKKPALRYLHRALQPNPHFSVRYAPQAVRAVHALEGAG